MIYVEISGSFIASLFLDNFKFSLIKSDSQNITMLIALKISTILLTLYSKVINPQGKVVLLKKSLIIMGNFPTPY